MLALYYLKFNTERKCRDPEENILIQPMSLKKLDEVQTLEWICCLVFLYRFFLSAFFGVWNFFQPHTDIRRLVSDNCNQVNLKNPYSITQWVKPHSHLYPISIPKHRRLEFRILLTEKKYFEVSRKTFPKRPRREFSTKHTIYFSRYFR